MKQINSYIIEKLHLNKDIENQYNYCPQNKYELAEIIYECIKENGIHNMFHGNLNDIDVSNIEDMSGLILEIDRKNERWKLKRRIGNIDISKWDVSNLKRAQSMFLGCPSFNCDLSDWNVENLENATAMFTGCEELDFDISKWNPVKLKETNNTWKMITNTKLKHQDWMR